MAKWTCCFLAFEPPAWRRPPPASIIFVLEEEDAVFGIKLKLPAILSVLETIEYKDVAANKDTETVIREIQDSTSDFVVWCSLGNYDRHFGPDLVIHGKGQPARITVPWSRIVGVVRLHKEFKFRIGLRPT